MFASQQIAALKDQLSQKDPNYTAYPLNTHKVSNTPALSTVSEESSGHRSLESRKHTPRSTSAVSVIQGEDHCHWIC